MSLANAQRALEIVDVHLVATQSKLKEIESLLAERSDVQEDIDKIVDHLDLIIGDIRAASEEIAKHECPDLKELAEAWKTVKPLVGIDIDAFKNDEHFLEVKSALKKLEQLTL